jgi:OOP family OmpA-OmpF porin
MLKNTVTVLQKDIWPLLAMLGLVAVTAPAMAMSFSDGNGDDYNPSWYIAPSINGIDPDSRISNDLRGEGVGFRFGKPLSQEWDLQFGATFSRSRDDPNNYRRNTLAVDGLYLFSRGRLRPFLLIGAGAEYDKINTAARDARQTSPFINAGLGVQYS